MPIPHLFNAPMTEGQFDWSAEFGTLRVLVTSLNGRWLGSVGATRVLPDQPKGARMEDVTQAIELVLSTIYRDIGQALSRRSVGRRS
jgi:hypothetical protein